MLYITRPDALEIPVAQSSIPKKRKISGVSMAPGVGQCGSTPGDGLQLSFKGQGWKGVKTILHSPAHGWMPQNAANLRRLHVLHHNSTNALTQHVGSFVAPSTNAIGHKKNVLQVWMSLHAYLISSQCALSVLFLCSVCALSVLFLCSLYRQQLGSKYKLRCLFTGLANN